LAPFVHVCGLPGPPGFPFLNLPLLSRKSAYGS
jgi:hypothetical protein